MPPLTPVGEKSNKRLSWFAVISSVTTPKDEFFQQHTHLLDGISEVRWCQRAEGGYMWFLCNPNGKFLRSWETLCARLGHTISPFNDNEEAKGKSRTLSLWRIYADSHGPCVQEQLRKNVHVLFERTPRKPKADKENQNSSPAPSKSGLSQVAVRLQLSSDDAPLAPLQLQLTGETEQAEVHPEHTLLKTFLSDECTEADVTDILSRVTGKMLHLKDVSFPQQHSLLLSVSRATWTVEIHRRTMELERAAVGLAKLLLATSTGRDHDSDDLSVCLKVEHGEGQTFWNVAKLVDAGDCPLKKICIWMAANRDLALRREYLIPDWRTFWSVIICEMFLAMQKPQPNKHKIRSQYEQMQKIRQNILVEERVYLHRYAELLTRYCQKLTDLIAALDPQATIPKSLRLLDLSEAEAPTKGDRMVLPVHGDADDLSLPKPEEFRIAAKCRIAEEKRQLQETCKILAISFPPPIATTLKTFLKKVKGAMQTDTHTRSATRFLPPSPSHPTAEFDPGQWRK